MSSLVLQLWVLSLAILFQASNSSGAAFYAASFRVPLVQRGAESNGAVEATRRADCRDGDCRGGSASDRPEDGTKELSAVDDSSGNDFVPPGLPDWCKPPVGDFGYASVEGLGPLVHPAAAPFKPPEPDEASRRAWLV